MLTSGQKIKIDRNAIGYSQILNKQFQDGYLVVERTRPCFAKCNQCSNQIVVKFVGVNGHWCEIEKIMIDGPIIQRPINLSEYKERQIRKRLLHEQKKITVNSIYGLLWYDLNNNT